MPDSVFNPGHGESRTPSSASAQADMLAELYWFIHVVEAGSLSAAANRMGLAKSSLSRHLIQLEKRLNAQLLHRNTRSFSLTTLGEQVYRHALEMLSAAEAVETSIQQARGSPNGLLRLAVPSVLSGWLLPLLAQFQRAHPAVHFSLLHDDAPLELAPRRLDLALSLDQVPADSSDIVARPGAQLRNLIVASPALLARLGQPQRLDQVEDHCLLGHGSPEVIQPWRLHSGQRQLQQYAMVSNNLNSLRDAAKAGIGLACLPALACSDDLASGALALACPLEHALPSTLYLLTPSYRGITLTTRSLLQALHEALQQSPHEHALPLANAPSLAECS